MQETNISSAVQREITFCSFGRILYTFKASNKSLHLAQSVNIKDSLEFLLKHACVGKFTFVNFGYLKKKKKKNLLIIKSESAFYV